MADRLELQKKFEDILGCRNAYYQPPENLKMNYPAIRYSLNERRGVYANDKKYIKLKSYDGIAISRKPDPDFIEAIMDLPYVSFGKPYISDNLYHYPFTIYH